MNVCPHVRHVRSGMGSRRRTAFKRSPCRCRYCRLAIAKQSRHHQVRPSGDARRFAKPSSGLVSPHFVQRFFATGAKCSTATWGDGEANSPNNRGLRPKSDDRSLHGRR